LIGVQEYLFDAFEEAVVRDILEQHVGDVTAPGIVELHGLNRPLAIERRYTSCLHQGHLFTT
jgi:hypothetical protein